MRFRSSIIAVSALLLPTFGPLPAAWAADPIGSAIAVTNVVTAEIAKDKRRLATGDDVHQNELIEVGEESLGELKFRDDTKLALGAGSRVVLDKYVYDPDKTSGSIIMNLVKGTFRFITGVAAKPTYLIKTPHASISVRGTMFDVYVREDGAAWLLLIEGSLKVCNDRGQCSVLDEPGKLVRIDDEGNIGKPTPWKSLPGKRRIKFDDSFPFVSRPPRIADVPDFTEEIVNVGVIPPIIFWPRHPRWPHRPPTDGGHGGKNPSDGKNPTGGKYPPGGPMPGTKDPGPKGHGPVILKGKDGKPHAGSHTTVDKTILRKRFKSSVIEHRRKTHVEKILKINPKVYKKHTPHHSTGNSGMIRFKSFKGGGMSHSTTSKTFGGFGMHRGKR
jgi:hypothetical protein